MTEKISERLNKIRKHLNSMGKVDDVVLKELESIRESCAKLESDIDHMVSEETKTDKIPHEPESLYKKGDTVYYIPQIRGFNPATELIVAAVNYTEGENDVPFPTKPGFYYTFEGTALRAHESDITDDLGKAKKGADIKPGFPKSFEEYRAEYESHLKTTYGLEIGDFIEEDDIKHEFDDKITVTESVNRIGEKRDLTPIRSGLYFKDGGEIKTVAAREFNGKQYYTIGADDGHKPLYSAEEVLLIRAGYRIELELNAARYNEEQMKAHVLEIKEKFKHAELVLSHNEHRDYWRVYATDKIIRNKITQNKQGFSCSLLNRKDQVIDTMNVSFKEEDYAKDAFKATGIAVKPTDYIRWN